jgi:hypothetical protein
MGAYPGMLAAPLGSEPRSEEANVSDDVHLRSAGEVRGYHIQGSDDVVGHVEDFILDDETWAVRYLVIDTSNWWFGKKVLVDPRWATRVSWQEQKVHVDLSRQAIKNSPEWDPTALINREYEQRLHDHYRRPAYWGRGERAAGATSQQQPGRHS